ncbi:undecaprenyl-diphosphate phosphatase [Anaerobacillus sp. MEB173]|uniref:undecaprenyl-diphosphate phosphatase n=1 Tax=Anaerobacillus sp. MEB173 TaxID=3383345 RepID=UPI003F8EEE91
MNWFEAFILGVVQGISEFLPISSSAHLVIVERLLGIHIDGNKLEFEVLLHLASLFAVILYFWKEIYIIMKDFISYLYRRNSSSYSNFRFGILILIATLITGVFGKGLEGLLGDRITNSSTIGASLIVTGLFLILIEHGLNQGVRTERDMTWKDGIIVGFAQTLAIIPGISRAGSTLIASLWYGLSKETAVRYSFILSIPIIFGISLMEIPNLSPAYYKTMWFETLIAFSASFIFAIIGIKWLIHMLNKAKLTYFAIYCIILGACIWIFLNDIIPIS